MPETLPNDAAPPPLSPHTDLALRLLYDEQTRLRAELDQLRQKQDEGAEKKPEGGEEKKEGDDQGKNEKGGDKKGGDKDQQDKDQQGKDDKGKDDKEQKEPAPEKARHWVRENPIWALAGVVGLVVLIIGTILLFRYLGSYESTDDAFVEGHTDPISPRINGFVTGVYVENTNHVKKGQLLVQLDARDYQVAKEQAGANLGQAEANVRAQAPNVPLTATTQATQVINAQLTVASSLANVAASEERARSALADYHQAEANARNARNEEERYRLLVAKEEVSREQYDQRLTDDQGQAAAVASRRDSYEAAMRAVTQAAAQLDQSRQQLKQAKQDLPRQIAIQRETIEVRKANAKAALAQADQAELNLEYTRIYAPEDGIIGNKSVELATQVQAGQELFALTQTNDIWVEANFKETEIQKMRPGQSVRIHVDALSMDFDGYVEALPGGTGAVYSLLPPENATGNYVKVVQRLPVRIRFKPGQPGENRLAPGMSVEPKVWVK